ncbi:MAG: hypothetical protein AAF800_12135 [Planctomycetota bacterium]
MTRFSFTKRRVAGFLLLLILAFAAGLAFGAYRRTHVPPEYWGEALRFRLEASADELERRGRDLQRRAARVWTYPIGDTDGVRTLDVAYDDLNAWLTTRLPAWLANQNLAPPAGLGRVFVTAHDGHAVLAAEMDLPRLGRRVVSLAFTLVCGDDDRPAALGLASFRVGRQPLPRGLLLGVLANDPTLHGLLPADTMDRLGDGEPVPLPPLPVDEHRDAHVLALDLRPDAATLTVRVSYRERE